MDVASGLREGEEGDTTAAPCRTTFSCVAEPELARGQGRMMVAQSPDYPLGGSDALKNSAHLVLYALGYAAASDSGGSSRPIRVPPPSKC